MQLSDETKKELDVFLKTSLTSLTSAVDSTTEALKENAPIIAKEIVLSELIDSTMGLACSLLFLIPALFSAHHIWMLESRPDFMSFLFIVSLLVITVSTIFVFCALTSIVKAKLTPRLIIFNYVAGFLKPESKED